LKNPPKCFAGYNNSEPLLPDRPAHWRKCSITFSFRATGFRNCVPVCPFVRDLDRMTASRHRIKPFIFLSLRSNLFALPAL
jgi:hypothetical protein